MPWVPFHSKAPDTAFNSPPIVSRKLLLWMEQNSLLAVLLEVPLSLLATMGRPQELAATTYASLSGTKAVPTWHCCVPGRDAPSRPSMALHTGPYPSLQLASPRHLI